MDLIQQLITLVQSLTTRLNDITANSKTNEELPVQNIFDPTSLIRVSKAGVSSTITPQRILDNVQFPEPVPWNGLIRGGVTHVSGLTYNVWVNKFAVNGILYNVNISQLITLNPGDSSNPRIDVVAVTVNITTDPPAVSIVVIEGVPDPNPIKPTVNLETQVEITLKLVAAGETVDPDVVTELVYDENLGEPGEWDNSFLMAGGNLGATDAPFLGSTFIEAIDGTTPADPRLSFDNDATIQYNASDKLVFALKTNGVWDDFATIKIKLIDITSGDYKIVSITRNNAVNFGFYHDLSDWQVVTIEFSQFVDPTITAINEFDRIEFVFDIHPYIDIDWINIKSGGPQSDPVSPRYIYENEDVDYGPADLVEEGKVLVRDENGLWVPGWAPEYVRFAVSGHDEEVASENDLGGWFAEYNGKILEVLTGCIKQVPTGANLITDINKNGTTIISPKLTIDAGENTSITSATQAVITVSEFVKGDIFTADRDQVGSTDPGKGHIVVMKVQRTS